MSEPIQSIAQNNYILQAPPASSYMNLSGLEYDGDKISGYAGSAFKAGDELPEAVSAATDYVTATSGDINATIDNVSANSGAWGGSALPISAGPGVKFEMVNNTLVASTDETVLYSGTAFIIAGSDNPMIASVSLNESINNFDKIRLDFSGSVFNESVTLTKPTIGTTNATWYNIKKEQKSNSVYIGTMYVFTDANTLSGKCSYGDTQVVNDMTGGYWGYGGVYRVVGINRIAGGN